jgi:hypothetical protein
MCAADKPSNSPNSSQDGIVHDGAKQRAWRAAKLREAIDNQTPSEIMEARTGTSVPRFGIDGLDEPESKKHLDKKPVDKDQPSKKPVDNEKSGSSNVEQSTSSSSAFTEKDIDGLSKAISEPVFLLPEQGLIFTKAQLAKELGVTVEAMAAMTDEGYERLGLVLIRPSR